MIYIKKTLILEIINNNYDFRRRRVNLLPSLIGKLGRTFRLFLRSYSETNILKAFQFMLFKQQLNHAIFSFEQYFNILGAL